MLAWLSKNIATIIICLVLAVIVTLIIFSLVKIRKKANPPAAATVPTVLWQAPATARISKRAKSTADKHNRTEKRTQRKLRPFAYPGGFSALC